MLFVYQIKTLKATGGSLMDASDSAHDYRILFREISGSFFFSESRLE